MRRTHNDDGIADCVCLLSRNEERGINQMMRFQRARDLCCRFSLRGGNIKFRVALDTLNIKSSKKYEPFAPSATHTASKREEEL
jgi:hypothetical protein